MKKINIVLIIILVASVMGLTQSVPQGMNYQAVARDQSGAVMPNQPISLKVTLQSKNNDESRGYTEIHKVQTNNIGLFSIVIGRGTKDSGDFFQVPWETGDIWMELSIDAAGGNDFKVLSKNQLLTVPYAFHAATATEVVEESNKKEGTKKAGKKWDTTGNSGLDSTQNILGTLENLDIVIKTNDAERMRVLKSGEVKIADRLEVGSDALIFGKANIADSLVVGADALINGLTIGRGNTSESVPDGNNTVLGQGALLNTIPGRINVPGEFHQPNTLNWPEFSPTSRSPNGVQNLAIGLEALRANTIGFSNTAVGLLSMREHIQGDRNTALGGFSLVRDTSGFSNTAIGYLTLNNNISGNRNTALGYRADVSSEDIENATAIGANTVVSSSNSLVLGNDVNVGIGTSAPDTSAILDLSSNTRGFLPPRMADYQRDAISNPTAGLMIYCTNCGQFGEWQGYNGATWTNILGGTPSLATASLSTSVASNITPSSAVSGGNIISEGGAPVTSRGVCWSTSPNPTIALSTKSSDGVGTGTFTSLLTGLSENTLYYVRAYVTNSIGTSYGEELSFSFATTTICSQEWMVNNLNVSTYSNGDPILEIADYAAWDASTDGAYCYFNNDPGAYAATYGKLYNWYAVDDPRGLCPSGWHVPDVAEWTDLATCLGGFDVAGGAMKEAGTAHWQSPNTGATNSSGFTGLPGGLRVGEGQLYDYGLNILGSFWTSTIYGGLALQYDLEAYSQSLVPYTLDKNYGISVRCVKD